MGCHVPYRGVGSVEEHSLPVCPLELTGRKDELERERERERAKGTELLLAAALLHLDQLCGDCPA